MAELSNVSDHLNRRTGGNNGTPEEFVWFKNPRVAGAAAAATIAGRHTSLWQYEGAPSHGAAPGGSARYPTRSTNGGIKQTNPGGSPTRQKWAVYGAVADQIGTLLVVDRIADISGLSGTVTTAQTINLTALTRYSAAATCLGNLIFVEVYTQIGATPTTLTASYVNQDGNNATTPAVAIGGTGLREAQRMIQLPLASGDTGVRGVNSVTLAGTTGTAGDFGITIVHQWGACGMPAIGVPGNPVLIGGAGKVVDCLTDACVSQIWLAGSTTSPYVTSWFAFVEA